MVVALIVVFLLVVVLQIKLPSALGYAAQDVDLLYHLLFVPEDL
jgi:hypothetical protein